MTSLARLKRDAEEIGNRMVWKSDMEKNPEVQAAYNVVGSAIALISDIIMEMEKGSSDLRAIPVPEMADVAILLAGIHRIIDDDGDGGRGLMGKLKSLLN